MVDSERWTVRNGLLKKGPTMNEAEELNRCDNSDRNIAK